MEGVQVADEVAKQKLSLLEFYYIIGFTPEELNESIEGFEEDRDSYYGTEFTPRADVIGDDITDISDMGYGNNDVAGPDAFHGTFCSGIIAATMDNGIGIDGISGMVQIMGLRAVPDGDEYDKDVALAIRYAVDNGADIVNMSFGKAYSPQKSLVDEAIKYAESKGVLLVHAAGNSSLDLDDSDNYPSDLMDDGTYANNVLTIGASTYYAKTKKAKNGYSNRSIPAYFSNYGKERVDFFAPGHDIISTYTDNSYDKGSGTSYAAPVVSGIAALLKSYFPKMEAKDLKEVLMASTTDKNKVKVFLPGTSDKIKFSELSVTGGVVNAAAAVQLAMAKY